MVCDRSWLYTAISRAKQQCVLIGPTAVAKQMCRQSKMGERKTFLKELVLEGSAREVLANV
jgi:ATP-dependent exoDNAse (exonuclease V) alpha subunit